MSCTIQILHIIVILLEHPLEPIQKGKTSFVFFVAIIYQENEQLRLNLERIILNHSLFIGGLQMLIFDEELENRSHTRHEQLKCSKYRINHMILLLTKIYNK